MMKIDATDGKILVGDGFYIIPYQNAWEFLNSELYNQYSLDQATLESLALQKRVVLKIADLGLQWYFTIDFAEGVLNSVRFYLARKSMREISQAGDADLELFAKLFKNWFGEAPAFKESRSGVVYRFPWGFVKSGTYPDGVLAKVIVGYKRF
jgi:hypothetical protein